MLFELASEDRLRILWLLERSPLRLMDIARKLSATDPEVSRHISRLGKAGLVAKGSDGAYVLTPLGKLCTAILPSFDVVASRKEHFLSHDLSALPMEFLRRIGDLAENQYLDHLDEVLGIVDEVTKGAEEYVWIMADRPLHLEHHHPKPGALSVRCLVPRSFEADVISSMKGNWPGAKVEVGSLETVLVAIVLNERRSGVMFSGSDGRIDYGRGLAGDSSSFHGWSRDLFGYFWGRARKVLH